MKSVYVASLAVLATAPLRVVAQNGAEDLAAPVLEWAWYILLLFALCVAIGVAIRKRKDQKTAPLASLFGDQVREPVVVSPETSVKECVTLMNRQKIGALLVMDEGHLEGIFTERDALKKVLGDGLDPSTTKVSQVMTRDPQCVDPTITVGDAMTLITHRRFRHLPVVEGGSVRAVISSGDLTRWLVRDDVADVRELVEVATSRRRSL